MSYIYDTPAHRPNRLSKNKGKSYHNQFARHCISSMSDSIYREHITRCLLNWDFFKGGEGQWVFQEDTEGFFLDESGDIRNRIKWTKNVVKPMVQQYVGNAIRLAYDAKAECISDFVITEKEKNLARLKNFQRVSEMYPFFKDIIKEQMPIGDTELETEEIFENTFVQEYEEDINNLIEFISKDVDMDEIKVQITRNLAMCGLGIYKGYESCDLYCAEATNPLFFIRDLSAKKPDLSDSSFMGEWSYMDATTIFEKYPKLNKQEREAIERYGSDNMSSFHRVVNNIFTNSAGKVPVYEVYWRDTEEVEYGWVNDEDGYPYYTRINHESTPYKDKHLIEPQTDKHKEQMGKKKKHKIYVDVLRYAIFIPKEEIGISSEDIMLEWGEMPYQEKNRYNPSNVKFPYKCYTWVYDRGDILTPLDDVIDPQRFLNRTMSVIESHLSNMRGSGTAISKDAVDDNEAETTRNINSSKPIYVDTSRTGSVQNSIGQYGTNIGNDTYSMFQVIQEVQRGIQDVTGVNEAMTGTQGASDALVGVIDAQIQRGSLVQEPFYYALTSILKQGYNHQATVGKAIYADNPRKLAMMVGDKGLSRIKITEDHLLQDYRIFIKRSETREQGIQAGNQLLFTLLQGGLIDQTIFSNLFDRADSSRIAKALREFSKRKLQAQNMADKQNAQLMANQQQNIANQMEQQQVAQVQQTELEQLNDELKHERELERIDANNRQ